MTTVLVAESDPDLRDLVSFKLTEAGWDVIAVSDGLAALATAREQTPELAVLDPTLPGLSGADVCRALRATPDTRQMLILLRAADVHPQGALADDYVGEPVTPAQLTSRVAALLARRRGGRPTS